MTLSPLPDWNPEQYGRFRSERAQPFFDLLDLVQPRPGMRVVDLGCGTGELTHAMHRRLAARETLGIDSSPAMLARSAAFAGDGLSFQQGDLATFASDGEHDLVFSNAAIQWVPDHDRVEVFAPDGTFLRAWGSAGTSDGQFGFAVDATGDAAGNVYVSDGENNRIQVFDSNGTFMTAWGGEGAEPGQFREADALALDGDGHIYVLDFGNRRIQKFRLLPPLDPDAGVSTPRATTPMADADGTSQALDLIWQTTGGAEPLFAPAGAAFDAEGNIWLVDAGNDRIQIISPEGDFLETWDGAAGGGEGFAFAKSGGGFDGDVAFDSEGNIYVAEAGGRRVQKFDADRQLLTTWGEFGSGDGQFIEPIGIAVDDTGNVYVIDDQRNDVQKFDADGAFVSAFGGQGSGEGELRNAGYLAVDHQGNVWVADFGNNRVVTFAGDGTVLRTFGEAGTNPGQFSSPVDVAVDAVGMVYVADLDNGRIQVFDATGQFLAAWEAGTTPSGSRNLPYAVAVDGQGSLYVIGVASDYDSEGNVQKFRLPLIEVEATPSA